MTNALAYYDAQLIIAVKVFLIQALGKEGNKKESLLQLFSLKILTKKRMFRDWTLNFNSFFTTIKRIIAQTCQDFMIL